MNDTLDFVSVMAHLGLNMKRKYDNYECPFCQKKSFTVYPDEKAYCHSPNCHWSGDSLKLFCEYKQISREEAYKELGLALQNNFIQIKEQTYDEAKVELAKDLEFLAWVRMYEGFYGMPYRIDRKILEDKAGLTKGTLSKIINGQMVNALTWRKVLAVLRADLEKPIERLKKNIALGTKYFEQLLDDEKRGNDIKKYRNKKR
jgi:hypothetical protein